MLSATNTPKNGTHGHEIKDLYASCNLAINDQSYFTVNASMTLATLNGDAVVIITFSYIVVYF